MMCHFEDNSMTTSLAQSLAIAAMAANAPKPTLKRAATARDYELRIVDALKSGGAHSYGDLVRICEMPRNTAQHVVKKMEADGVIHCQKEHGRITWVLGPSRIYKDPDAKEYGFRKEPGPNGGTVVRFGDTWRTGPGLRPVPRGLSGGSPLAAVMGGEG
jgi:hypothetical protein